MGPSRRAGHLDARSVRLAFGAAKAAPSQAKDPCDGGTEGSYPRGEPRIDRRSSLSAAIAAS
jgi:hypothetical protein